LLSGSFLIIGVIFALLKEKGAILMAGFNSFSKEKRDTYDKKLISEDARNMFFIWTAVTLVGGLLAYFVSFYLGIIACILWLILVFKEVKFDIDKAFEKYRL
jgi:predicted PurR-regulated permease PerM